MSHICEINQIKTFGLFTDKNRWETHTSYLLLPFFLFQQKTGTNI